MQPTNQVNYTYALWFKGSNEEYQLKSGANTIGRSRSNTINVKDCKYLSRRHCTIYLNDSSLSITNNSSKGYTKITRRNEVVYLNHNQSSPLYMGDTIKIAQVTVTLKYKKLLDNVNSDSEINKISSKIINIEHNISKTSESYLNVPQNSPNINHSNPFSLFTKLINNNNSNSNNNEAGCDLSIGPDNPNYESDYEITPLSIAIETKAKKIPRASGSSSINSLFSSLSIDQDQQRTSRYRNRNVKKTLKPKTDKLNSLFNKISISTINETSNGIDEAYINSLNKKIITNNNNNEKQVFSLINNTNSNNNILNQKNYIISNNHNKNNHYNTDNSNKDDNISLETHQKLDRSNSV